MALADIIDNDTTMNNIDLATGIIDNNDRLQSLVINYVNDDLNNSFYARGGSNYLEQLEAKLVGRYCGSQYCYFTSSGMAAITSILEALVQLYVLAKEDVNIILSDELYTDDYVVCDVLGKRYNGVKVHLVNVAIDEQVISLFDTLRGQNNIFFVESCSNPTGKILNYELVPRLKAVSETFYFVVDNTWLTSVVFNPFVKWADFVVLSLTKYYSGGKCIGGALLTKNTSNDICAYNKIMDNICGWIDYTGNHTSPISSLIILLRLSDMVGRLQHSYDNTIRLIKYIEEKYSDKVWDIRYPLLESHESYALARQYFNEGTGPSIFTFVVRIDYDTSQVIFSKLKKMGTVTSYGHVFSTIDSDVKEVDEGVRCRLAVGYGDYELCAEALDEFMTFI